MVKIGIVMMLKNEEKRLQVSLNSVKDIISCMIIYDTGSIDNTINILKEFSEKHNIPLHLKQGEFIDYSTSRNVLLDYADTIDDVDFLLLLDCNDELRGSKELLKFANSRRNTKDTAWLVCQEWFSGDYNKYYNIRFIRARCNWRYKGVIHEYLQKTDDSKIDISEKISPKVILFQDRTLDDDKSFKRFTRDRELLLKEHQKTPECTRTLFYLAQTCACLGKEVEAYTFYEKRSRLKGFNEEQFHSFLRMGNIARNYILLNSNPENTNIDDDNDDNDNNDEMRLFKSFTWENCLQSYMKAFECLPRVECLLPIIEHYIACEKWHQAFLFGMMACELPYPKEISFIDNNAYEYKRWHLMGSIAFYVKQYQIGYDACKKICKSHNKEIDKNNLKFYEKELFPKRKAR